MPDDSPIKKDDKQIDIKDKEKERESLKNQINALKADVYELIKQQEMLVIQNNQIQELKMRKVQVIEKLEASYNNI